MSSAHVYKSRFQTLVDKYADLSNTWINYQKQVGPNTSPSAYSSETKLIMSQITAIRDEMIDVYRQLDLEIEAAINKAKVMSTKALNIQKSNKELRAQEDSEKERDETAKGLYQEERNLYNLNMVEVALYIIVISLMIGGLD